MDEHRKHQVSLRGASAKEISRDALLEKVSQERELRNYARRASSSALFIQRVWRRYDVTKKEAERLREEWASTTPNHLDKLATASWISSTLLRPFLFFVSCLCIRRRTIDVECIHKCFKILLESVNSADSRMNFCSLVLGTPEERRIWTYQSQKLVSLCSFILATCDKSDAMDRNIVALASLVMRFLVVFTDLKGWKIVKGNNLTDADMAMKDLVGYMGSREGGLYSAIREYITRLDAHFGAQTKTVAPTDDRFLITASVITLAIRPFQITNFDSLDVLDMQSPPAQYCLLLLTIPWFTQRLPAVLLPALKHKSVLLPCFRTLLILGDNLLEEMSKIDHMKIQHLSELVPSVGWALANIICLTAGNMNDFVDPVGINQGLQYALYVRAVITLADKLLSRLQNAEVYSGSAGEAFCGDGTTYDSRTSYMQLLWPVCEQWHLVKLLGILKADVNSSGDQILLATESNNLGKLKLLDIAYFYSNMLRIYSMLNPTFGSLPVLNMLSFCPGYITTLWESLEGSLFPGNSNVSANNHFDMKRVSGNRGDIVTDKKQKQQTKDGGNTWANVLNKITGKSQADSGYIDLADGQASSQINEDTQDYWDIEPLRCGPQMLSRDLSCLLHLFCATYAHLLLVLDDIEFYEKQVPFMLEKQRRIASMLNTSVYNGAANAMGLQDKPLMDSAIRCLHLLYERDCRHPFCPPALWLAPARKSRPPIAVAARTHEISSAQMKSNDTSTTQSLVSVITATPHVYPFEERVQMFREFINMDKVSRRMAGEVTVPGSRTVEIVVRRDHVVEDGFRQLNSLGSKLKSSIHVSFVSKSGLPEAGLDYGGLSKEFLTDISKAAFSPDYGLFVQTSTSDRLLIPNPAARYLDNGIHMIEFLGRVVGKALYEGILLDYSFSHVFVQKLLGRYSFLDELSTLDPELYRNLMYVKHYDGDAKELFLDFTVMEESFGKRQVFELKPGGKDISVTNENKMQYVHAMADYKLNRQILPFSNAFCRGLADLISPSWLKLFNASEFNQLLSGGELDIDVDDLRNNTQYTGGYSEGSRTIKLFWEVIRGFEPKERCLLLKFVTSCSRAPLLGFKHLQPSFTIHKVACDSSLWATIGGQDVDRLPSASTCYNTLKLPTYKRASTLRAKLLYAISSNTGFELS